MQNWDIVIKAAKDCHSKQSWNALFDIHGKDLSQTSHAKPLQDIFKLLESDPQRHNTIRKFLA